MRKGLDAVFYPQVLAIIRSFSYIYTNLGAPLHYEIDAIFGRSFVQSEFGAGLLAEINIGRDEACTSALGWLK